MNEDFQEKTEVKSAPGSKLPLILSIVGLIGVIVLFVLYFSNCDKKDKNTSLIENGTTNSSTLNAAMKELGFTIAYVDTDRLWNNYGLVQEVQQEVVNMETLKDQQFQGIVQRLQNDFEKYLQTGSSLSLSQQQDKEAEFKNREIQLEQQRQNLLMEVAGFRAEKNKILEDSIVNYIIRYNQTHNYTLILEKTGVNGVLYGDSSLDITSQVLEGLNAEYNASKQQ